MSETPLLIQSIGCDGDGQQTGSHSRVDGNGVTACGGSVASAVDAQ